MGVHNQDIGQYVGKLHNKIRRELDLSATNNGISGAQARVMIYLLVETKTHDVFQKDIEDKYSIRPSTASAMLKKMAAAGLIRREPLPTDNRLKRIVPTAKAQAAQAGVWQDIIALEAKLGAGISAADMATFFAVVEKMLANLG